ncbi:helix-turn-helix domain-containing protein [uncultured Sphingomonas sp.]|uniref:helix-turn-helix domain-containing protein n=1 Tax=uncultured Sphingomonas sp. TaxID=158754 RepID=UPI0025CC9D85|nr:helix-turn-helix transcriptional regulator [uncultured Sphingomonas sp.]
MIVAANIQSAMERIGTNPAELARTAGLNATGIYDIISGRSRNPRLDTIAKIATALRMPVAELFEERTDSDLRNEIIDAVSRLPAPERKRILMTARAWADAI